ncbi:MAG: hypothetical protein CMK09_07375 [Ponticaulis sp.]|nr:hypothetical protein [Ponticaulis sp.]
MSTSERIIDIDIDDETLSAAGPDAEHERRVAIFDLLESNTFSWEANPSGPYKLKLLRSDNRLLFEISAEDDSHLHTFILSLAPFRRIVKDYFLICDSYYDAIRNHSPNQIEAIDMARRGVHNEGSDLLSERLKGKILTDFDTSRRIFTLICALHQKS